MNTEEKFAALGALAPYAASLWMRNPGDWYVHLKGVEIGGDGMLASPASSGKTPFEAIEKCWAEHATLPAGRYIVLNAMQTTRRHVRWNGFMWQELPS